MKRKAKQEAGDGEKDDQVRVNGGRDPDRPDDGREAQDPEDVENVGPDAVPYGDVDVLFPGRGDGRHELGQGRADGDDGGRDEEIAQSQKPGQGDGPVHRPASPEIEGRKPPADHPRDHRLAPDGSGPGHRRRDRGGSVGTSAPA